MRNKDKLISERKMEGRPQGDPAVALRKQDERSAKPGILRPRKNEL